MSTPRKRDLFDKVIDEIERLEKALYNSIGAFLLLSIITWLAWLGIFLVNAGTHLIDQRLALPVVDPIIFLAISAFSTAICIMLMLCMVAVIAIPTLALIVILVIGTMIAKSLEALVRAKFFVLRKTGGW